MAEHSNAGFDCSSCHQHIGNTSAQAAPVCIRGSNCAAEGRSRAKRECSDCAKEETCAKGREFLCPECRGSSSSDDFSLENCTRCGDRVCDNALCAADCQSCGKRSCASCFGGFRACEGCEDDAATVSAYDDALSSHTKICTDCFSSKGDAATVTCDNCDETGRWATLAGVARTSKVTKRGGLGADSDDADDGDESDDEGQGVDDDDDV